MSELVAWLGTMTKSGASDLHVSEGHIPMMRLAGKLTKISDVVVTGERCHKMIMDLMTAQQVLQFDKKYSYDFAYELSGGARFRCNIFRHQRGLGGVFRLIPAHIKSISELGLPEVLLDLSNRKRGLILLTGPTGSGKSTTLAAMIDHINQSRDAHIITIEDPVEFVHRSLKSRISQREVGIHAPSFSEALLAAMREDPDVILVGEMRDLETIALTITAAETGVLVFATLHTNSAAKSITRILDVFPENQREQVRVMLSKSVAGIVAQQLVRTKDQKNRVAAVEVLKGSSALGNLIREGKISHIQTLIEMGRSEGMTTMDQSLMGLIDQGKILARDAHMYAIEKEKFMEGDTEEKAASLMHDYASFSRYLKEQIDENGSTAGQMALLNISFDGIDLYYEVANRKDVMAFVSVLENIILKNSRGYDSYYASEQPRNILVLLGHTDNARDIAQRLYDVLLPFIKIKTQNLCPVDVRIGYAAYRPDIKSAEAFIAETKANVISSSSVSA